MREQIIEVASSLFSEIGYDKTTVSKIISELQISRGGFYHHFKSKEEILEVISLGYVNELKGYLEACFEKNDQDILTTMNDVFTIINGVKLDKSSQWKNIQRMYSFKGSHKIIFKMAIEFESVVSSFYCDLIEKGNRAGIFNVIHSEALADLWTRELLKLYEMSRRIVMQNDPVIKADLMVAYEGRLDFIENIVSYALGVEQKLVTLHEAGKRFVDQLETSYQSEGGRYD